MARFPADESCDYSVVRALVRLGHEVLAVADLSPRADDESVIGLALREQCVLLTEDKDFGQLVHARRPSCSWPTRSRRRSSSPTG